MKTRRFLKNKLVRDGIVEDLQKQGVVCTATALTDDNDYLEAITQKLIEELQEVFSSESTEELLKELGDFEDALTEFKRFLKLDQKDIDAFKAEKLARFGTFSKRMFLECVDVPESNKELIADFEERENRYPAMDLDDLNLEDDEEDSE